MKAAVEVLLEKLARRQVPLKSLVHGDIEPAGGGRAKQTLTVQQGISAEKARDIVRRTCASFIEMEPNREHNFCCAAGGGVIN